MALLEEVTAFVGKYKVIVYLIVGMLLAFGFDFKTPKMLIAQAAADAKADNLRVAEGVSDIKEDVARTKVRVDLMEDILKGLGRIQCRETPVAANDAGIPCEDLNVPLRRSTRGGRQ